VAKANDEAHRKLQETWHTVEQELGLLVSKLVDGNAFHSFFSMDAGSVDMRIHHNQICSGNISSAKANINMALGLGFAAQTWAQLLSVFLEIPVLGLRFLDGGLDLPSGEIFDQAWDRATESYQAALDQHDAISETTIEHYRSTKCSIKPSPKETQMMDKMGALQKNMVQLMEDERLEKQVQSKDEHLAMEGLQKQVRLLTEKDERLVELMEHLLQKD
jgi:hypothetical protein